MRRATGGGLPVLLLAVLIAGCSSSPAETGFAWDSQSGSQSNELGQQSAVTGDSGLLAEHVDGLPFDLLVGPHQSDTVDLVKAKDAEVAVEGVAYETLGETEMQGHMPGPMPRVVLDDGSAFGSLMHLASEGDVTSLEDIPSEAGVIAVDGTFTPLQDIAAEMSPISGSNPDGLLFEPQHASAAGEWVVWREGSAGEHNALPTLDSDDWRLVAWDRDTGVVSEIASAFLVHGDRFAPYASWDVAPSSDGTLVYFEAMMPAGDDWENTVISVPLEGGSDISLLGRGLMPAANPEGGVFWISLDWGDTGTVVFDGEPLFSVSGEGWSVRRLAASSDLVVATVWDGSTAWLVVYDVATGQVVRVVDTGSDWAEVSLSGRSFVWGNSAGGSDPMMYFMDAAGDPIALWGVQGLSAPLINGEHLAVPMEGEDGAITWTFLRWLG